MADSDSEAEFLETERDAGACEKLRLGGMALRNGLLVHGPTHWAAAVRRPDGTIAAASGHKPRLKGVDKVAGVRGVVRLGEAMLVIPLVKHALPEAKLPFQDVKVLGTMAAASRDSAIPVMNERSILSVSRVRLRSCASDE